MATSKKAPMKKKAPAKKKATPKPEFKLEVCGDLGSATLSFGSDSARDTALAQLSQCMGEVPQGLQHCIKDDAGGEFRYMSIKDAAKI